MSDGTTEPSQVKTESSKPWRFKPYQPPEQVIGNVGSNVKTRSSFKDIENHFSLLVDFEPSCIDDALKDSNWINAMQ